MLKPGPVMKVFDAKLFVYIFSVRHTGRLTKVHPSNFLVSNSDASVLRKSRSIAESKYVLTIVVTDLLELFHQNVINSSPMVHETSVVQHGIERVVHEKDATSSISQKVGYGDADPLGVDTFQPTMNDK